MTSHAPHIRRFTACACIALAALLSVTGCSKLVGKATSGVSSGLSAGIENHDDPETVRAALPAYLIMLDGLIENSPDNAGLLLSASRLYGVYAGVFVDEPERATRLARRALAYAGRVFCADHAALCESKGQPFEDFEAAAAAVPASAIDALFAYAAAWAGLVQADSGNWSMIADIPKVQALLERVVTLDPTYQNGQPLLYLGVLSTLLPPAYGGKPEQGQAYFERALALSGGRNQMARVLYAQHYTRLVFDRELHDRLVDEALDADPVAPGLTLVNVLAQQRAAALKASADNYF
ncbi:TRAP transporter TatT component family protein [Pseudofulvimonas gallinarii]|jgi:hypothetical protein|uniref:TRAP transporter TatT component family protein n=1 Tax=Pseudofulvimonas gallinarii TaxID=634155 RepID=A0A4R3LLL0_9GAMM|nr:TRAP transporter TatT component family protein [Pseudofulvimonas gallinarii]TCT01183.1 TRAP transporter TatT component family protein [Pseudofulvimonas gallinarii]THD15159.1 hypothetical protein B1808_00665 [Pseudofulvimonas gallinarii]